MSDPENDLYEILAVIAEKGHILNKDDKEEPYIYNAPSFPGDDVITVWGRDHGCVSKEEIKIIIQQ